MSDPNARVTVRCPRCDEPVSLPVYVEHVEHFRSTSSVGNLLGARVGAGVVGHKCPDTAPVRSVDCACGLVRVLSNSAWIDNGGGTRHTAVECVPTAPARTDPC